MEERKITLSLPHLPILLEIQSEAATSTVDILFHRRCASFLSIFSGPQIKNEMKMLTVRDSPYPHKKVEERERENKRCRLFLLEWAAVLTKRGQMLLFNFICQDVSG